MAWFLVAYVFKERMAVYKSRGRQQDGTGSYGGKGWLAGLFSCPAGHSGKGADLFQNPPGNEEYQPSTALLFFLG